MTRLSNKIREYRFRNGEMTQRELAGLVAISRQTMNALENCRHAPTVVVAIRIADVFHVSVDELFKLEYDGKPARREQAATVALDRPQPTTEKTIEIDDSHEPLEEEAARRNSLANLRNILGS